MSFFCLFFSLTLLAERPEMHGNYGQIRISAAFIPEFRFQLEWNLMWKSLFCNMRSNDPCGVWCESAGTPHKVWHPFSLCFICSKYCRQDHRDDGKSCQISCRIIHLAAFFLCGLVFFLPFFSCCLPPLPCLFFVTIHTFKNLVTHSKPWEKKAKYRLKS